MCPSMLFFYIMVKVTQYLLCTRHWVRFCDRIGLHSYSLVTYSLVRKPIKQCIRTKVSVRKVVGRNNLCLRMGKAMAIVDYFKSLNLWFWESCVCYVSHVAVRVQHTIWATGATLSSAGQGWHVSSHPVIKEAGWEVRIISWLNKTYYCLPFIAPLAGIKPLLSYWL